LTFRVAYRLLIPWNKIIRSLYLFSFFVILLSFILLSHYLIIFGVFFFNASYGIWEEL